MPNTSSSSLLRRIDALTDAVVALSLKGVNHGTPCGTAVAFVPGLPSDWPTIQAEMLGYAQMGIASVAVLFDRDQTGALPFCLAVQISVEPTRSLCFGDCAFWMAEDDDTLLIVPTRCSPEAGHFAAAEGYLTHRAGWPADDLTAGLERARRRLAPLAKPQQRRTCRLLTARPHEVKLGRRAATARRPSRHSVFICLQRSIHQPVVT